MADTETTHARRMLNAIEAALEGRASKDTESYTIEGRSLSRTPIPDLLRLRAIYRREVAAEENPSAAPFHMRRVRP